MADYIDFELSQVDDIGNAVLVFADSEVVYTTIVWDDFEILDLGSGAGGQQILYTHRVFDTVAGRFVRWTALTVDDNGSSYPGPGTFGIDTSDFTVLYSECYVV